ncbi:hypothetical protein C7B67_25705 [filamentous cyanobacterium Phorm 6]|nr:hypothetical protein C7B67_25705 [filamentous cyanobacterium Phorm 6]
MYTDARQDIVQETGFLPILLKNRPEKKELLPIDFCRLPVYYLYNGSGDIKFNFSTIPIIRLYFKKLSESSFEPEKKGVFFFNLSK